MHLHVPNYLQKDFKALVRLAYIMKKKNPDLKRNIKFDKDNFGLYIDIQTVPDGDWRRVRPDQARKAAAGHALNNGSRELEAEDLRGLLGEPDQEQ